MDLTKPFDYKTKEESFIKLQDYIIEKLKNKETFFIGRLSGNEPNLCGKILKKQNIPNVLLHEMLHTAGICFKSLDDARDYVKEYTNACKNSTMLGIWSHGMYFQATHFYELIFKLSPDTPKICAQALEPYYFMKNENYRFNEIFQNQRVLVITSHVETTKRQIALSLNNIYDKPIFDTTTSFHLYKPPQQNAGNSDNQCYKVHLQKMKEDLDNIAKDFDFTIALVSCGGFGMLISDYIYKMNKSVIYVGGALQLYFGIMGNRWRTNANITPLYNSYWTNVLNEDKPESLTKNSFLCENSCYW